MIIWFEGLWYANKFCQPIPKGNVLRLVWRICICILGLKGLRDSFQQCQWIFAHWLSSKVKIKLWKGLSFLILNFVLCYIIHPIVLIMFSPFRMNMFLKELTGEMLNLLTILLVWIWFVAGQQDS